MYRLFSWVLNQNSLDRFPSWFGVLWPRTVCKSELEANLPWKDISQARKSVQPLWSLPRHLLLYSMCPVPKVHEGQNVLSVSSMWRRKREMTPHCKRLHEGTRQRDDLRERQKTQAPGYKLRRTFKLQRLCLWYINTVFPGRLDLMVQVLLLQGPADAGGGFPARGCCGTSVAAGDGGRRGCTRSPGEESSSSEPECVYERTAMWERAGLVHSTKALEPADLCSNSSCAPSDFNLGQEVA